MQQLVVLRVELVVVLTMLILLNTQVSLTQVINVMQIMRYQLVLMLEQLVEI